MVVVDRRWCSGGVVNNSSSVVLVVACWRQKVEIWGCRDGCHCRDAAMPVEGSGGS
jgi:hypothetical protein